jgi:hypothetical protein
MARGGNRCKHRPVRYEFLEALVSFAEERHGSVPTHYGWWQYLHELGYTLAWSSFRTHTAKLEREGLIRFDHNVIVLTDGYFEYQRRVEELPVQSSLFSVFALSPA